jgi:hypothetical protein
MTIRRALPLLICALPALAGCAHNGAEGPLKPMTRLEFSADDMAQARKSAADACADYQQQAQLLNTTVQNGNTVAIFTCR